RKYSRCRKSSNPPAGLAERRVSSMSIHRPSTASACRTSQNRMAANRDERSPVVTMMGEVSNPSVGPRRNTLSTGAPTSSTGVRKPSIAGNGSYPQWTQRGAGKRAPLCGQNGAEQVGRDRRRDAAEPLIFIERHELRSLPNALLQPIELDEIAH